MRDGTHITCVQRIVLAIAASGNHSQLDERIAAGDADSIDRAAGIT